MSGVRADQGQAELLDFLQQSLEATVLRDPCADLRDQIFGDIDGARFAIFLEGDVLRVMERAAVMAATFGTATAMGIETEGGGEDRAGNGHLAEPGIEHAANERGVIGNAHSGSWESR